MSKKKIVEEKELIENILKKLDNEETKDLTDAEKSLIEKTLRDAAFNESQQNALVEKMNDLFCSRHSFAYLCTIFNGKKIKIL